MTLHTVWKQRLEQQLERTKPAHDKPASLWTARTEQLDRIGEVMGVKRKQALEHYDTTAPHLARDRTEAVTDEVYRFMLFSHLEHSLKGIMYDVERFTHADETGYAIVADILNHHAAKLGLKRKAVQDKPPNGPWRALESNRDLHERCLLECSRFFDGPPPHLRKPPA